MHLDSLNREVREIVDDTGGAKRRAFGYVRGLALESSLFESYTFTLVLHQSCKFTSLKSTDAIHPSV